MAPKMICYMPVGIKCKYYVMISRIVRLSKKIQSGITIMDVSLIHLDNGDFLESEDSIATLQSRIESKD
jgi:hypothetical protein